MRHRITELLPEPGVTPCDVGALQISSEFSIQGLPRAYVAVEHDDDTSVLLAQSLLMDVLEFEPAPNGFEEIAREHDNGTPGLLDGLGDECEHLIAGQTIPVVKAKLIRLRSPLQSSHQFLHHELLVFVGVADKCVVAHIVVVLLVFDDQGEAQVLRKEPQPDLSLKAKVQSRGTAEKKGEKTDKGANDYDQAVGGRAELRKRDTQEGAVSTEARDLPDIRNLEEIGLDEKVEVTGATVTVPRIIMESQLSDSRVGELP